MLCFSNCSWLSNQLLLCVYMTLILKCFTILTIKMEHVFNKVPKGKSHLFCCLLWHSLSTDRASSLTPIHWFLPPPSMFLLSLLERREFVFCAFPLNWWRNVLPTSLLLFSKHRRRSCFTDDCSQVLTIRLIVIRQAKHGLAVDYDAEWRRTD